MADSGPLAGITVIDLTRVLAGPYATMILADLGARVIKVEKPETGDDARQFGPFVNGKSAYFMSLNRGKESIALDLNRRSDRAIFDRLLGRADVLVENFRPGTLARLGYDWQTLHRRHPRLIYAAVSGFGATGPYAAQAAYDLVVQAMGGLMSLTGHPDGPPTRVGTSIGDIAAGLFTAVGIASALASRARDGVATMIDVGMLDCQVAILENAIVRFAATGEVPTPIGTRHPSVAPFDVFAAADGRLAIAAGNDSLFRTLCDVIDRPDLAVDPRFCSNEKRNVHQAVLKTEIETMLRERPAGEWLERLQAACVPAGPINTVDRVVADPHVQARRMIVSAVDAAAGRVQMAGNPIKFSAFEDEVERCAAPDLDADRARILAELAEHGAPKQA